MCFIRDLRFFFVFFTDEVGVAEDERFPDRPSVQDFTLCQWATRWLFQGARRGIAFRRRDGHKADSGDGTGKRQLGRVKNVHGTFKKSSLKISSDKVLLISPSLGYL